MINPSTRSQIPVALLDEGSKPDTTHSEMMSAARSAQALWAAWPMRKKLRAIRHLRRIIAENARWIAESSANPRSRPVVEVLSAEVLPLLEACRFLERAAKTILAPKLHGWLGRPFWLAGVTSEIHRDPFGVVLVIGPGNYPLLLPGIQILQSFVAGNAVLLKPGSGGMEAALTFHSFVRRAGIPADLLQILPESVDAARGAIGARPDKVVFTGAAATGEKVLEQLAPHLIPATLELSGCDAVIVRADADLDLASKALVFGLRLNGGATCISPKRVFVHRAVAAELGARVSSLLRVRWGDEHGTAEPERIPAAAGQRLHTLVGEATRAGAHVIAGARNADGSLSLPLVLTEVSPQDRLLQEDFFRPVMALVHILDDEEAIAQANRCPYGLGASIFTRDLATARKLAGRINAGVVTMNDLIVPTADPRLPFGGRGRSGYDVTRGAEGLLSMTRPKVITLSRSRFRPAFEPPRLGHDHLFLTYMALAHGGSLKAVCRGLWFIFRNIVQRRKASTHQQL
jgi:acyl-CoA reductase-like NAD-dependent aldehyde dehydrogenase